MPRKKQLTFEESLAQLETIVKDMESGDATLQELMTNYSQGIELSKNCLQQLTRAEQTMDLLVTGDGETVSTEKLEIEGN